MSTSVPDFEVGIIGGGPAGSSMASYLAKAGVNCVVFERDLFPREHVGESLVPSSTRVFKDLNFLPKMEEAKFPHKFGAAWTAASDAKVYNMDFGGVSADCHVDVRFAERDQGVGQNYTYHVDRGKFDLMLLQHANQLGAKVYEGIGVSGVDFSNPNHATVNFKMGKKDMSTTCKIVVDASGRKTIVGNQMKWRIQDKVFDQYAIHTWFDGYDRRCMAANKETQGDFIFIHFLPITNTWVWQIPITETVTSIGVVTQKKNFATSKEDREKFFWECIKSRPELYEGLRAQGSQQVKPFKEEGDYSYAMKQITGDRIVLVGDAARFVDPIFSTGVSIALNCSRFAHKDILKALETGNFSRESFQEYESTLKRGTRNWYNFITVYYRLNVLFTAFVADPRYRLDVLKLLQGDVYDEAQPEVLTRMQNIVRQVEANPNHALHGFLGDLTADAFVEAAV
ncbi:MAG TPA: NAD(P)/FAD-dependent oxidoreductase [Candidatus Sulfotelmatobacter sp.]|nr:NAD(P)/FAD-dependent oxidoreductase [Candidatus Sulfotelmatobacter sp.]